MTIGFAVALPCLIIGCAAPQKAEPVPPQEVTGRIGSRKQREQLFDWIVSRTMQREAFSAPKNRALNLDVKQAMLACRDDVVEARSEHELIVALHQLSCARRDRHLKIELVPWGLKADCPNANADVPLRFAADFENMNAPFCFVSDLPVNNAPEGVEIGDRVIEVNGQAFRDWKRSISPYLRSSTDIGLWWELARALSRRSRFWPAELNPDRARYKLRKPGGKTLEIDVELVENIRNFKWMVESKSPYPGWRTLLDLKTFTLYAPRRGPEVLLIAWHAFKEELIDDLNTLVKYAQRRNWLDRPLIIDCTTSRGGSLSPHALQRLFPKPFRTTFCNVRISDAIPLLIANIRREIKDRAATGAGFPRAMGDGSWLVEWLEMDVEPAIARGDEYSNEVPFKLAHLPRNSKGFLFPIKPHFRGRAIVLLGPHGGSQLDQFASIIVDNSLATTIGMPTGGYSNTWEHKENLFLPGTAQQLVRFMWSIGHTIRPNGEVLEGNPANVDEWIPVTQKNSPVYRQMLVQRALKLLDLPAVTLSSK
ncbi:MAG: hypothetical protein MI923_15585 [Phycisphaerales bacterium]|nr:hypothetical protein [Phycisphaerales bacterium]